MVFWPQLVGGIEIQERRPRSFNEPRRKRLSFVKDRKRSSGDWALVTSNSGRRYYESEQELWDRRQFEANQRFIQQQEHQLRMDREQFMLRQPIPRPPLQGWNPEMGMGHDPRMQPLPPPPPGHDHLGERGPRGHHDDHEGGIEIVSSDSDSDSNDDGHGHGPRLIERAPKQQLPKHFKHKRSKSRGRKDKKKKRPSSLFSSDSSSDDEFAEGFRYGRKASMSRRPLSRRGRSRSRVFEHSDDSFEDLEFRRLPRSNSRGLKWRGK